MLSAQKTRIREVFNKNETAGSCFLLDPLTEQVANPGTAHDRKSAKNDSPARLYKV
jgi:hypothetical protein